MKGQSGFFWWKAGSGLLWKSRVVFRGKLGKTELDSRAYKAIFRSFFRTFSLCSYIIFRAKIKNFAYKLMRFFFVPKKILVCLTVELMKVYSFVCNEVFEFFKLFYDSWKNLNRINYEWVRFTHLKNSEWYHIHWNKFYRGH